MTLSSEESAQEEESRELAGGEMESNYMAIDAPIFICLEKSSY
jgi:hypothetical protein